MPDRFLVSVLFREGSGRLRRLDEVVADLEAIVLREALQETTWNRKNAAKLIGIPKSKMYRLCGKHGLGR